MADRDNSTLWWALGGAAALFALSQRSRIANALEAAVYAPRLESYLPIFQEAATTYGVPPSLLAAVAHKESGFRADAVNIGEGDAALGGAWGLMQVSFETAQVLGARIGYTLDYPNTDLLNDNLDTYTGPLVGILDPHINVALAAADLAEALRHCGSSVRDAGCYYNSGKCCGQASSAAWAYGDDLVRLQSSYLYLDTGFV